MHFQVVTHAEFEKNIAFHPDQENLEQNRQYEGKEAVLGFDEQDQVACGFTLENGNIGYLFSHQKGAGRKAIEEAIRRGGYTLNCFDGHLVAYYQSFGFCEVERQANWSGSGPDVVFMSLL